MRNSYPQVALALGVMGLSTVSNVRAASWDTIALSEVPSAVRQSIGKVKTKVKFTEAYRQVEGGTYYKLAGKDSHGREFAATFSATGDLLSTDAEIDPKQVPRTVAHALKAKESVDVSLKGFKSTKIIKSTSVPFTENQIVGYWHHGKNAAGEKLKVRVSEDGKHVAVKDDAD